MDKARVTKPSTRQGYTGEDNARAQAVCLFIATKLGDLMDDIVIVGGLVPSMLIPDPPAGAPPHAGTADVDLGFGLAVLDDERYSTIAERLRDAGFAPDKTEKGTESFQRWRLQPEGIVVDFLIQKLTDSDRPGTIKKLEPGFGALFVDGLDLAFKDRRKVTLNGRTIRNEVAERDIWVCGCGSFLVLKAFAHDSRGANKDAHDLCYVLQNYGAGIPDVVAALKLLGDDARVARTLTILQRDFTAIEHVGTMRAVQFEGGADDQLAADIVGAVVAVLAALKS